MRAVLTVITHQRIAQVGQIQIPIVTRIRSMF
jgi:hypothetical protein